MSPQDEIVLFHHYTLFVDEAGDDKVDKLKPLNTQGNSEWLCLGGYLIRSEDEASLERRRNDLWTAIFGQKGRPIHYRNLKDFNRLRVCKALAQHSARAFVVCSFKETTVGHENHRAARSGTASSSSQYFYNFVVRLLLERVTEYVAKDAAKHGLESPKLNIVLASRKGHHFGHFKAYVL
ncbi:MAG: DUF3800 domain-containing protein [Lentibacter sp.]|uniref:DUF3800 domain-containing protein n=1 Tax=Lentibacter sp. TaxID=2024994 RepID=UPI00260C8A71|nr:DUF3800 domain-containing protein [Lentibacter sp.]MDG1288866.1 DUF3800 domain-containing protein [Lentibacter sp.]